MTLTAALLASTFALGNISAPALQDERPPLSEKPEVRIGITDLHENGTAQGVANSATGFHFYSWVTKGTNVDWDGIVTEGQKESMKNELRARAQPFLDKIIERLHRGLGPVWRAVASPVTVAPVRPHQGGMLMRPAQWITISGPMSADSRAPQLRAAVLALSEEQTESERAQSLPAGPEREAAKARASAAAARADEAMSALRIESAIIPVTHANGEDIAKALKLSLPWATFTSIGGTQIMASGTKDELDSAKALVSELDAAAKRQMEEAARTASQRSRDTPAGRVLAQQINIDFKGGQLPEYLDQVGGVANVTSWVIEDPRVSSAFVPPVKLTGVTVDSALKLLDGMLFPSADKAQPVNAILRVMRIDPDDSNPDAPPIYRIGANFPVEQASGPSRPAEPRSRDQRTITEVFDVAVPDPDEGEDALTKAREAHEALLAAIEAGVGLVGPGETFKVKLHPPSGMLFVSGTPSELDLVRNIVQQWQSRR